MGYLYQAKRPLSIGAHINRLLRAAEAHLIVILAVLSGLCGVEAHESRAGRHRDDLASGLGRDVRPHGTTLDGRWHLAHFAGLLVQELVQRLEVAVSRGVVAVQPDCPVGVFAYGYFWTTETYFVVLAGAIGLVGI